MQPTIGLKGTFSFNKNAVINDEMRGWLIGNTAIEIIIKILKLKTTMNSDKVYFLNGRTGSGKSTKMISDLYSEFLQGGSQSIFVSEPRVVLTKANALDVIRYDQTHFKLGVNVGINNGSEKIPCSQRNAIYYCTTQILSNQMALALENDKRLGRNKFIVIDEVHEIDLPMMELLKMIKTILLKYGSNEYCPIFIFASATIDEYKLCEYFLGTTDRLTDPLISGYITGKPNFPVEERFIDSTVMSKLNKIEIDGKRDECYIIISKYYFDNYYKLSDASKSLVKENQCRDVLIFIPLVHGIEKIAFTLKVLIKDKPVHIIEKGDLFNTVTQWRNSLKGKKRILIVGYGRDYSPASDVILSTAIDPDKESLDNETKIFIATSAIETGKTISTLYICVDSGIETMSIYNPLVYDINDPMYAIKQLPTTKNKATQRMGRVGREAPGIIVHFYSKEIYSKMLDYDLPSTINRYCLSKLLMPNVKLFSKADLVMDYLYPISNDILIRSYRDLVNSGYLTRSGITLKRVVSNTWMMYAQYLVYVLDYSIFEAVLLSRLNMKQLPEIFELQTIDPKSFRIQLDNLKATPEVIESIKFAKNEVTRTKYNTISTFNFMRWKLF